jgi:hypothetical protein
VELPIKTGHQLSWGHILDVVLKTRRQQAAAGNRVQA